MQTDLCIADLLLCCFKRVRTTVRDRKTARLKHLVTSFRQAIPASQLGRTLKTHVTLITLSPNNVRFG